jgi:hypothetical protein
LCSNSLVKEVGGSEGEAGLTDPPPSSPAMKSPTTIPIPRERKEPALRLRKAIKDVEAVRGSSRARAKLDR